MGKWGLNPELYDINADPGEINNIATANPQEVARLQALLEGHRNTVLR